MPFLAHRLSWAVSWVALLGTVAIACDANTRDPGPFRNCIDQASCEPGELCSPQGHCTPWAETPCGLSPCQSPGTCALTIDWDPICLCPDGMHPSGSACETNDASASCNGIECSGRGSCVIWYRDTPLCDCEAGTHPLGLHCVPNDPWDPCLGVPCDGGGGACTAPEDEPLCDCAPEHEILGQQCLPLGAPLWRPLASSPQGVAVGGVQVTWDASAQEARLFAGSDIRTWAWREHAWVELSPNSPPPPRSSYCVTYDEARQRHVLFGGIDYGDWDATALADTWELVGDTWSRVATPTSPLPRYEAAMGYDPDSQRVVLIGGWDPDVALRDTWVYDGTTWTELSPGEPPSWAGSMPLAWNPASRRLALVHRIDSLLPEQELVRWELAGEEWVRVPLATNARHALVRGFAYHPLRNRWILLGTFDLDHTHFIGDDDSLYPDTASTEPPTMDYFWASHALIWVPSEEVLLLAGWSFGQEFVTWEYQWEHYWPPEDCGNGIDDDHNGATDCSDPGCEGMPCTAGRCERGACNPWP